MECPLVNRRPIVSVSIVSSIPEKFPARSHPHRFPHRGFLPEGRYFTLTWGIGYDYGGMTTVALERSSAFARLDNRSVEILTLSPEMKGQNRGRELRAEGRIDRRVTVRNLWDDLTSWPDRKLRRMVGTIEPDHTSAEDVMERTAQDWSETQKDSEDKLLQVDRYHDRGHLLVIDRHDMKKRGHRGGRRITLFDRDQKVIAQWSTARDFYHAWLDVVIGTKPSYLICDSAFVGNFIHEYRRDNVILSQVVHSHHLAGANGAESSEFAEGKFGFLTRIDGFDLVVTLTDRQRKDLERLRLSAGKLRTVSNLTEDLNGDPDKPRVRGQGAMIARLVPQKRVGDAITAIATAVGEGAEVMLDVYGEGEDRTELADLIDGNNLANSVKLHGHTPSAKTNFRSHSFSLLTSQSEGQGLVVLESLSAGCIPICYDVDFGPADIIEHGVNGYLVPNGDIDALANTISEFMSLPESVVAEMRGNAVARAADFFEVPIVRRWGEVLAKTSFAPITRVEGARAEAETVDVDTDAVTVSVRVSDLGEADPEQIFLSWKSRTGTFFGRVETRRDESGVTAVIPQTRFEYITEGYVDFSLDLVFKRGFERVRITSSDDTIVNRQGKMSLYSTKYGNLSGRIDQCHEDAAGAREGFTSTS